MFASHIDYYDFNSGSTDNLPSIRICVGAEESSFHNLNTPQMSPSNSTGPSGGNNDLNVFQKSCLRSLLCGFS